MTAGLWHANGWRAGFTDRAAAPRTREAPGVAYAGRLVRTLGGLRPTVPGARPARSAGYFFLSAAPSASVDRAAMNASCGTSTRPTIFMRFLPSFCFSSSLRLREMSPP